MNTLELPIVEPPADAGSAHRTAVSTVPARRGPASLRIFAALLAVAAAMTTVALMLSDRAPGVLRAVFGDTARSVWARIDADRRGAIVDTGLAQPDLAVHLAVWGTVTFLAALTIWSWRWLAPIAGTCAVGSAVVELGQTRWASTRAFELSDVAANVAGVALGAALAAAVMGLSLLLRPTVN